MKEQDDSKISIQQFEKNKQASQAKVDKNLFDNMIRQHKTSKYTSFK